VRSYLEDYRGRYKHLHDDRAMFRTLLLRAARSRTLADLRELLELG
jgi:hypothetical protein